jgi:hypothetical protein
MTRWEFLINNLSKVGAPEGTFNTYDIEGDLVIHCTSLSCLECPYHICNSGGSTSDCTAERAKDYSLIIDKIYKNHPELLV